MGYPDLGVSNFFRCPSESDQVQDFQQLKKLLEIPEWTFLRTRDGCSDRLAPEHGGQPFPHGDGPAIEKIAAEKLRKFF